MTGYCRHDLPAGMCADCAPRNPDPGTGNADTLVVIKAPGVSDDTAGRLAHRYHRHGCPHLTNSTTAGKQPWPRYEVHRAEVIAHPNWRRCTRCAP